MELLVRLDAGSGLQGAYVSGDIVLAMPDGQPWGTKERPPLFAVLSVPDTDTEDIDLLTQSLERKTGTTGQIPEAEVEDVYTMIQRRRMSIDLTRLPDQHRTAILATGSATIRRGLLTACLEHRV